MFTVALYRQGVLYVWDISYCAARYNAHNLLDHRRLVQKEQKEPSWEEEREQVFLFRRFIEIKKEYWEEEQLSSNNKVWEYHPDIDKRYGKLSH